MDAGAALVVIESMKMETTLVATASGRVDKALVTEGELVAGDQVILAMDYEGEGEA